MPTIYGVIRSRASRPIWLCHEAGISFDHVPVIQGYRAAAAPGVMRSDSTAFRAVNPMGQIPALRDGDLVLTESLAICLHLARAYGGALGPQGTAEAALAENWALFAATAIEPDALAVLVPPEGDTAEAMAARIARLHRPFAALEAALTGQDWLMGGRFTVADLMVAECLRYASGHAGLMEAFPRVKDWLARCHARPAFQKMWAARLAEPA